MRTTTLAIAFAIAVVLAFAASPALTQTGPGTPAVEPPPAAQVAPSPPNPPKLESVPAAPKAPRVTDNVPPGRFSFNRVDDGFLRLDNSNGQIAYCSPHTVGWACQAVPEDRAALETEIARLQAEVAGLRQEVAKLREPPPPPQPPVDLTPESKNDKAKQLRDDVERARAAIESAWRRLVELIANFQKDMMRKG